MIKIFEGIEFIELSVNLFRVEEGLLRGEIAGRPDFSSLENTSLFGTKIVLSSLECIHFHPKEE